MSEAWTDPEIAALEASILGDGPVSPESPAAVDPYAQAPGGGAQWDDPELAALEANIFGLAEEQEQGLWEDTKDVGMDLVASFGAGSNALLGLGGTLYGLATGHVDNWATRQGEFGRKWWNDLKSADLVAAEDRRRRAIDETDGEISKAGVALWETVTSPGLLANFLAEQVPNLVAGGVGGLATKYGTKAGAGALGKELSEEAIARAGQAGAVGSTSALSGADAAQQTLEQLKRIPDEIWLQNERVKAQFEDLVASGMDKQAAADQAIDAEALRLSRNAFAAQAVLSLATNLIPGAMKIEEKLSGVKVPGGARVTNIAKGGLGEAGQEAIEEGGAQLFANIGTREIDASQGLFEGVGEAAGLGAVFGVFGAAAGATQDVDPDQDATPIDKKRKAFVDAVQRQLDAAENVDAEAPGLPPEITDNGDGTYTLKGDGGETTTNQLDLLKSLLNARKKRDGMRQGRQLGPRPGMERAAQVAATVLEADSVDDAIAAAIGSVSNAGQGLIGSRMQQNEVDQALAAAENDVIQLEDLVNNLDLNAGSTYVDLMASIEDINQQVAELVPALPQPDEVQADRPIDYADPRLKRLLFREDLEAMKEDFPSQPHVGSGIVVADPRTGREEYVGKVTSGNADWVQSLLAESGMTAEQVRTAIDKALRGNKLGSRQHAMVVGLLDQISENRVGGGAAPYLEEMRALRDRRRWERQNGVAPGPGTAEGQAAYDEYMERFAEMGGLFDPETYAQVQGMEVDEKARKIYDLSYAIEAMGGDPEPMLDDLLGADFVISELEEEYARLANRSRTQQGPVSDESQGTAAPDEVQQTDPEAGQEGRAIEQPAEGEQPGEGFRLTQADPESTAAAPSTAAIAVDLFGEVPVTAQAIADAEREQDTRRNTGTADMTGTLFGQDRQQVDIADAADANPPTSINSPSNEGAEIDLDTAQPTAEEVDAAANEAATSPENDLAEPTEAQKEAGNYKKGPLTLHGLSIKIENPRGSVRSGTAPDGTRWENTLGAHYGDIKRTVGAEGNVGEGVDVFVGPNPLSKRVWVIDQIDQNTGAFDEHKVMMGFNSEAEAITAYKDSYDAGWKVGPVTATDVETMKAWALDKDSDMSVGFADRAVADDQVPQYRGQGPWGKASDREKRNAMARDQVWFLYRHIQDVMRNGSRGTGSQQNKKAWRQQVEDAWSGNEPMDPKAFDQALLQLVADGRVLGPSGSKRTYSYGGGRSDTPDQRDVIRRDRAQQGAAPTGDVPEFSSDDLLKIWSVHAASDLSRGKIPKPATVGGRKFVTASSRGRGEVSDAGMVVLEVVAEDEYRGDRDKLETTIGQQKRADVTRFRGDYVGLKSDNGWVVTRQYNVEFVGSTLPDRWDAQDIEVTEVFADRDLFEEEQDEIRGWLDELITDPTESFHSLEYVREQVRDQVGRSTDPSGVGLQGVANQLLADEFMTARYGWDFDADGWFTNAEAAATAELQRDREDAARKAESDNLAVKPGQAFIGMEVFAPDLENQAAGNDDLRRARPGEVVKISADGQQLTVEFAGVAGGKPYRRRFDWKEGQGPLPGRFQWNGGARIAVLARNPEGRPNPAMDLFGDLDEQVGPGAEQAPDDDAPLFSRSVSPIATLDFQMDGVTWKAGEPVTFTYARNTQPAPDMGGTYQQDIEPAGRYMVSIGEVPPNADERPEMEYGEQHFEQPLYIAANTNPGIGYDENSWKAQLVRRYGVTGRELSKAIRADGYDGIVTIELGEGGEPRYIGEIVDLSGIEASRGGRKPRLQALHTLSAENLLFADSMGGLAMPSIAILPEGLSHHGYGEITLIGTRELADPAKNPVHDSDAYTARFPKPDYRKVPSKKAQALVDRLRPFSERFHGSKFASVMDVTFDRAVNYPDPAEIADRWYRDEAVMAMYAEQELGVKNLRPIMRTIEAQYDWIDDEVRDAYRLVDEKYGKLGASTLTESPEFAALSDLVKQKVRAGIEGLKEKTSLTDEDVDAIYGKSIRRIVGDDGVLNWGGYSRIENDIQRAGTQEIDAGATREHLEHRVGDMVKFKAWVDDTVQAIFDAPRIKISGRWEPYTLDNIVRKMAAQKNTGAEDSITFGEGNARAAAAKRFRNLETMRDAAGRDIRGEAEIEELRKEAKEALQAWRDEVIEYSTLRDYRGGIDTWESLDNSMRALAAWAGSRNRDASALAAALRRNDFADVPAEIIDQGVKAGELMMSAPVPYFESKPKRAVGLDEFVGAVVPDDVSDAVIDVLERHGIPWARYGEQYNEEARRVGIMHLIEQLGTDGADAPQFALRAQHATPHYFDKFDLSYLGTGEGAQVYGWGLYFSTSRGVHEFYKQQFKRRNLGSAASGWVMRDADGNEAVYGHGAGSFDGTLTDMFSGIADALGLSFGAYNKAFSMVTDSINPMLHLDYMIHRIAKPLDVQVREIEKTYLNESPMGVFLGFAYRTKRPGQDLNDRVQELHSELDMSDVEFGEAVQQGMRDVIKVAKFAMDRGLRRHLGYGTRFVLPGWTDKTYDRVWQILDGPMTTALDDNGVGAYLTSAFYDMYESSSIQGVMGYLLSQQELSPQAVVQRYQPVSVASNDEVLRFIEQEEEVNLDDLEQDMLDGNNEYGEPITLQEYAEMFREDSKKVVIAAQWLVDMGFDEEVYEIQPAQSLEVEIDTTLEQLLDYDNPLSEQPHVWQAVLQSIRDGWAVGEILIEYNAEVEGYGDNGILTELLDENGELNLDREGADGAPDYYNGRDLYRILENSMGSKEASLALLELGVQGIAYNGDTSNRQNYVIFDDQLVEIIERQPIFAQQLRTRVASRTAGMRIMEVREALADQIERIRQEVRADVEVIHSSQMPPEVQQYLDDGEVPGGYVWRGKVYLVADGIKDAADARLVLAHELIGHHGVNNVVGDQWPQLIDAYAQLKAKGGKRFDEVYADMMSRPGADAYSLDMELKEFIAVAMEHRHQEGPLQRFVRQVRELVNAGLRRFGFNTPFGMSDIQRLLSASERFVYKGGTAADTTADAQPEFSRGGQSMQKRRRRIWGARSDQYTKDEQDVIEHGGFGFQLSGKTLGQRFDDFRDNFWNKFRLQVLDKYDPIKNVLGMERTWMKAQLSASSWAAMEAGIEYGRLSWHKDGVIDVDTNQLSLKDILAPLGEDMDRFLFWIAGNRANRLMGEGRENLFNQAQINVLMDLNKDGQRGEPGYAPGREQLFDQVRQEFEAFGNSITSMAVEAGLIDKAEADQWETEGFYLPFYRVLEEQKDVRGPMSTDMGLVRQEAFKRLKGGEQQLGDMLGNALMNWNHLLAASMKNVAAVEAIEQAEAMGLAKQVNAKTKGQDAIYVRKNGKPVWYEFDDSTEGDLVMRSLVALHYNGMNNIFMRTLRKAKRALTTGVTASPEFKAANLVRDTLQAIAVTQMDKNVFKNVVQGWEATGAQGDTYPELLASGAVFGDSGYINGADPDVIRHQVRRGIQRNTILDGRNAARKVWDIYQDFGARLENVNRAAAYEQSLANAQNPDRLVAAFESRDLLDFTRHGASEAVMVLAQTVPFLNARLQGLDKVGRSMADPKQRGRFFAVAATYSAVSIALYLLASAEDDWEEIEQWERDTYHMFKVGETWYRIPRPFEVGAIATLAERGFEQVWDEISGNDRVDGKVFRQRLAHMVLETFSFNPIPQAINPLKEIMANESDFTGRPIESLGMQMSGSSKSRRSKPWTSDTAKAVSLGMEKTMEALFGGPASQDLTLSPVQIEHLVNGYFGWIGAQVLVLTDAAITRPLGGGPERPDVRFTELPVIKRFVRATPSRNTEFATEFYRQYGEVSRRWADMRLDRAARDTEAVEQAFEEHGDVLRMRNMLNSANTAIGKINARMKLIYASEELDGSEKREQLDALQVEKNRIYEERVRAIRAMGK